MDSPSRNVVLVTFDSLRADHCGFVNGDSDLTPVLDELGETGTVFQTATAPGPRTATSVPEFITGEPMPRYDADTDEERMVSIRDHIERHGTIAETLAEEGYSTAVFSANPWTSEETGVADAFGTFRRVDTADEPPLVHKPGFNVLSGTTTGTGLYYLESWWKKRKNFAQWPVFFDDIVEQINNLPEPYFVWIFLMDTHNPYLVPREDRVDNSTLGMYYGMIRGNSKFRHVDRGSYLKDHLSEGVRDRVVGAYRDAVRSVDRFTGELTTSLDDDPIFLFHGDHGEGLGEHDSYGHQNVLYEENIHVPLLVADTAADSTMERADVTEPFSLRSLPDLIESLSADEGVGDDLPDGPTLSRTWSADTVALRDTRWKCILTGSETELYDLDADPDERTGVTAEHADVAARLTDQLEEFRDGLGVADVGNASDSVTLSADAEERLRTLGYRN